MFKKFINYFWELDDDNNLRPKVGNIVGTGLALLIGLPLLWGSFYVTQEGFRGVERTLGEVTSATEPGLHFKIPGVQTVDPVEIRPRKYELILQASTTGKNKDNEVELQMPSTVTITGNWYVDPAQVKDIVAEYGSIQQFEDRIMDPRVREATLAEFPKHTIEAVMTDRTTLSGNIFNALEASLQGHPVVMTDMMVADVNWHDKIKAAVLSKQDAKLKKEEEQYKLEKQNLEAQQKVNTASAEAESIDKISIAKAAAFEREGLAQAEAIKAKGNALKNNPGLVRLIHEERWNGQLPNFLMGEGASSMLMLQMPSKNSE
jgi:regulator of protease activity HflC (stomatin/prohibitin superfamily)